MDLLFTDPRSFVMLLSLLVSIASSLYAWQSSRTKAKQAEIKRLEADLAALEKRVTKGEYAMQQMPDREAVHRLEMGLEKVNGQLATLNERLNPIDNLSRRLQEVLLEKAG